MTGYRSKQAASLCSGPSARAIGSLAQKTLVAAALVAAFGFAPAQQSLPARKPATQSGNPAPVPANQATAPEADSPQPTSQDGSTQADSNPAALSVQDPAPLRRQPGAPPSGRRPSGQEVSPSLLERRDLVLAARESAVDELLRLIEAQPVRAEMTVKQLLDALPATARRELRTLLGGSPQLGGPRFPTLGTAEVQLQASGAEILDNLVALAETSAERSPIEAADLQQRLASWRGRVFTATGGSASSAVGPELRARPESLPASWAGVSEEARRSAYLEARDHAVNQFIETAGGIEVLANVPRPQGESTANDPPADAVPEPPRRNPLTLKNAFQSGSVEEEARQWLSQRPVSRMKYIEDRQIEVKLAVEPAEWVQQLRVSMSKPELGLPEIGEADWTKFQIELANLLHGPGSKEIVGRAIAAETERPALAPAMPQRPPEWTRQPLSARATAPAAEAADASPSKRRLATRQAAEALAVAQLRARLEDLPVTQRQTLGELARTHEAIGAMLQSSLPGVRVTAADYHDDGSVTIEMTMNPRALWQALEQRLVPVPLDAASQ